MEGGMNYSVHGGSCPKEKGVWRSGGRVGRGGGEDGGGEKKSSFFFPFFEGVFRSLLRLVNTHIHKKRRGRRKNIHF